MSNIILTLTQLDMVVTKDEDSFYRFKNSLDNKGEWLNDIVMNLNVV